MRMWMLPPGCLCRKHLLGEHGEIHKHKTSFEKRHRMDGRFLPVVQIQPAAMLRRHDELAAEMLRRGYNHKSPFTMPDISYLPAWQQFASVDTAESRRDLAQRCPECAKLLTTS